MLIDQEEKGPRQEHGDLVSQEESGDHGQATQTPAVRCDDVLIDIYDMRRIPAIFAMSPSGYRRIEKDWYDKRLPMLLREANRLREANPFGRSQSFVTRSLS